MAQNFIACDREQELLLPPSLREWLAEGHLAWFVLDAVAEMDLRQGELLALRWGDVDWPARRIRVRRNLVRSEFGTPKSKRSSRSVPLADQNRRCAGPPAPVLGLPLGRRPGLAHPHTGRPLDRSNVLKRFKAARRAGVRQVLFHDLRHTFGTRMAAAGVPMRTLQEWMGHRDFKTTLIYADYLPGAQEADLVDRAFARRGPNWAPNLSDTGSTSEHQNPVGKPNHT